MDGHLVASLATTVVTVIGAVGISSWRLSVSQSRSIGRLEGKMDGYDKRLEGFCGRVDTLSKRMNGLLDNVPKRKR